MKNKLILLLTPFMVVMTSCNGNKEKNYFKSWNDCSSLTVLKEYVKDVTNKKSKNYIPVEDRIVTFDMDGTFIGELYPTYFEYNMLEYRVLEDPDYKDIAPEDVKQTAQDIRDFVRLNKPLPKYDDDFGFDIKHAVAAAKAYSGMSIKQFDEYVKKYAKNNANGFKNLTFENSFYKPMLEVFDYLEANDFTYYVVSGSDRFICRALVDSLKIPSNRVIGMDVELKASEQNDQYGVNYTMLPTESLIRTDKLLIKNLKTNKVKQITQEIGKVPVLSFGNSGGDAAMHNYCLGNTQYKTAAFMLVADDDVRDHARKNVGQGEEKRLENDEEFTARINDLNTKWTKANYNVISMKDNFKTIYGEKVEKTSFVF